MSRRVSIIWLVLGCLVLALFAEGFFPAGTSAQAPLAPAAPQALTNGQVAAILGPSTLLVQVEYSVYLPLTVK